MRLLIPFILGFIYAYSYASIQLAWVLSPDEEGKPLQVKGMITTLPHLQAQQVNFKFLIKTIQFQNHSENVNSNVLLSWQLPPHNIHVGDVWLLTVYLKKIRTLMNPGSFDFETWSFQEGIRATGDVISGSNLLLNSRWYHHPVDRLREHLRDLIHQNVKKSSTSAWITALAIGERDDISPDDWAILRNTGTNHLIAIAGLHIGFMASFVFQIIAWIWRRLPRCMVIIPAQQAGAIGALLIALMYSAMAGFSIPTERACLMLSFLLLTQLLRRKVSPWHVWNMALLCVLLFNPLSVLTASFWLSFGTIALILYGVCGRLINTGWWWKHGRAQWVITVGLIPFSIGFFQQYSLVSFLANSIAIPCVGFLAVPLTLFGSITLLFSAKIGAYILMIANKIISVLWMMLTFLAHLSWSFASHMVPGIGYVVLACIGVCILLSPIGFPGKIYGIVGLLPLLLYKPPTPPIGDVWLTMLDVGQGLSLVVQTHSHLLVYDTGARRNDRYDMGENVVVPFLHTLNVKQIDRLVISHGDNDHIGGSTALLKHFPIYLVTSSVPEKFVNVPASLCHRGEQWEWDHVTFEFLYPVYEKLGLNNDSSCVLRVTSGMHHLLFTGDIEKVAEQYLTQFEASALPADILVAPHHGSKTSALDEFVSDVHPQIVLFSTGYRNRYHFPNPLVVQKYDERGAESFNTSETGSIHLEISKEISRPVLERAAHPHYWIQ